MLNKLLLAGAAVASLSLAACGTTPGDRALSGAGIGALGGAAIGAATGGSIGTGAVVGGVAGAVVGATTTRDEIDMGDPAWKRDCERRRRNGERVDCRD